MAQWKIGTGSSYAGITGFTWPASTNPNMLDRQVNKQKYMKGIPYTDNPIMIDQGTGSIPISIQGILWAQSDFDGLAAQAAKTVVDTSGRALNFMQRLYISDTDYMLVRNGSCKLNRFATNPLGYPYTLNFDGADPFIYTDSPSSFNSPLGGSPRSVSSIANAGNAYCFPQFRVVSSGATITSITITYGGITLTWTGSLPSGSTLDIYQDVLETNGIYGLHAYIGTTETGTMGGDRIILAGNATGATMTCTFNGGGNATFYCIVPNRKWG